MKQKHARKPTLSPSHVEFPRDGKPRHVVEILPSTQDGLEQAIVTKFVGRLAKTDGRTFSGLKKDEPWPDFECREKEEPVGIEVVELIIEGHGQKRAIQESYAVKVKELLGDDYKRLSGLDITLSDNYQDPPYPSVNGKKGKVLATFIAESPRLELPSLERLDLGVVFNRIWNYENYA